jgi:hypothetical protein
MLTWQEGRFRIHGAKPENKRGKAILDIHIMPLGDFQNVPRSQFRYDMSRDHPNHDVARPETMTINKLLKRILAALPPELLACLRFNLSTA